MGNVYFHALSACFSLLPWPSIFLAWWCLCLLSLPSGCLLICLFGGFLTPSSLLLCAWNSAEWWKSRDETKPPNPCRWPGHHRQGIQTIRVFMPIFSSSILPWIALRVMFAVCTGSWNFLLWTCSCEKGWQIRCVLQRFPATVRAQGYILGWQNHKALSKH